MRIINIIVIVTLLSSVFIEACDEPAETQIIGSWRIDSIYDNHNGFIFTNRNPYPREVYEYKSDKTVLRKGMGEQLEYRYTCTDSTLRLTNEAGNPRGEFIIVHLDADRLALKENKRSMFPGKSEVWYEVRYFSKIDTSISE